MFFARTHASLPAQSAWTAQLLFLFLALVSPANAANERTTLVLHAIPAAPTNDCFTADDRGFDCDHGRPIVTIEPASAIDVYLYVHNYDDLRGVQCAFDWPADWTFRGWGPFSQSACLSQAIAAHVPIGPGPTDGTLAVAFDRVLGGFTTVVGSIAFVVGDPGCLEFVEPAFENGTHVIDGDLEVTEVGAAARGRVCAGAGGIDACDAIEPVRDTTWSGVKALYR